MGLLWGKNSITSKAESQIQIVIAWALVIYNPKACPDLFQYLTYQ
jgi:hypothetical protein